MPPRAAGAARFQSWRWLVPVVFFALIFYFAAPHMLEQMFVFFPARELAGNPAQHGLQFEDLQLTTSDGVLIHGWFVPCEDSRTTLLIFHGNAGNISHRLRWIDMLHGLGAEVVIIDYRGYGRSAGTPTERGIYLDASAAYAWWRQRRLAERRLVLLGESLGGAVAVDLAAREKVDGLILQSTFTSAWDMAKTIMPLGLLQPLANIRFDSESKMRLVSCPKLLIHGDADDIVPYRLGQKLYAAAPQPKRFYTVAGAGHNDLIWFAGPEYSRQIKSFIDQIGS